MKAYFQQINLLYLALLGGQILFCAVVIFLGTSGDSVESASDVAIFDTLVPVLILAAISGAYLIHRKRTQDGPAIEGLTEKAAHYRQTGGGGRLLGG